MTTQKRPWPVTLAIALLLALGVGAVGGGAAMIFGVGGESLLPDEYLEEIPLVTSWLFPGLILAVGFGAGSLVTAYGVWRRPRWPWAQQLARFTPYHWSWLATVVLGVAQVAWILIELFSIPFSLLMPTFGLVGMALALIPFSPSFRAYLAEPTPRSDPLRQPATV